AYMELGTGTTTQAVYRINAANTSNPTFTQLCSTGCFTRPAGLAISPQDTLYVSEGDDTSDATPHIWASTNPKTGGNFSTVDDIAGIYQNTAFRPVGMATDENGAIYVATSPAAVIVGS